MKYSLLSLRSAVSAVADDAVKALRAAAGHNCKAVKRCLPVG